MAKKSINKHSLIIFIIAIVIMGGLLTSIYLAKTQTTSNTSTQDASTNNTPSYGIQSVGTTSATYNVGYQVKTISYRLPHHLLPKRLNVAIWYPTNAATQPFTYKLGQQTYDADVAEDAAPLQNDTPFPLIVFSHGLLGCGTQSVYLTWYWASQGYVVVAPDHEDALTCATTKNTATRLNRLGTIGKLFKQVSTLFGSRNQSSQSVSDNDAARAAQLKADSDSIKNSVSGTSGTNTISEFTSDHRPLDVKAVIDEMLQLNNDRRSPFYKTINPDEIGMAGHSLGGWTTAAVLGGNVISPPFPTDVTDSRIKAGVLLAPYLYNAESTPVMANVHVPTMFLQGSADTLAGSSSAAFDSTNPPSYFGILQGATHFAFDDGQCQNYSNIKDCGDQDPLSNAIRTYSTAFFNKYLKGDDAADTTLQTTSPQFTTYEHKSEQSTGNNQTQLFLRN